MPRAAFFGAFSSRREVVAAAAPFLHVAVVARDAERLR